MFWVKLDSLDIVLLSLAESFLYVFIMSYLQHAYLVIGSYIYNRRQNCWDVALKWSLENKTIHTPPSPRSPFIHSKLSCMLFPTGSNRGKTFCGGGEWKRHFPLLKSEKRQKGSLGQSVSTNFDADCGVNWARVRMNGSVMLRMSWEKY